MEQTMPKRRCPHLLLNLIYEIKFLNNYEWGETTYSALLVPTLIILMVIVYFNYYLLKSVEKTYSLQLNLSNKLTSALDLYIFLY